MIKTDKVTDRRTLRFGRVEDILRDVEWLNARAEAGVKLRASGNWTPAQIVDHLAKSIALTIDGFPAELRAPWLLRMVGRWMRMSVLLKPMKSGIRLRGKMAQVFAADPDVTWGQAVTRLTNVITRIRRGERMTAVSPLFGPFAHEEWNQFHCRHAEMHLSFVHAG